MSNADLHVRAHFDNMTRAYLRSVVNEEIIAEHRRGELGHSSEPLSRLIHWISRRRLAEPYAVQCTAEGGYRVVALPARRGAAPRTLDDELYLTLGAARHAVFLRHVRDLEE